MRNDYFKSGKNKRINTARLIDIDNDYISINKSYGKHLIPTDKVHRSELLTALNDYMPSQAIDLLRAFKAGLIYIILIISLIVSCRMLLN